MCYLGYYINRQVIFNTMPHYICTGGCGGVSVTPGVCKTEGCSKEGELLELCDCTDGEHDGLSEVEEIEEEQEEEE